MTLRLLFTFCITAFVSLSQGNNMISRNSNFNSFTKSNIENLESWKSLNEQSFWTNPDFGILPEDAPCKNCVEILSKRNEDERFFIDINDRTIVYQQKALGALHFKENNIWRRIDTRLKPISDGIYSSQQQIDPTFINSNEGFTSINTPFGNFKFNNWKLYGIINGEKDLLSVANWSSKTVGNDGMIVFNYFPGIDLKIEVFRGRIKSSFVVRENNFQNYATLYFQDEIKTNNAQDPILYFEDGTVNGRQISEISVKFGMIDALYINQAIVFPEGDEKNHSFVEYDLNGNKFGIYIPKNIIQNSLNSGKNFIIDPTVTSTNTLAQASITGSGYNATCFNGFCSYNLSVPTPANATVTNVQWSFVYRAYSPCFMNEGANTFFLGTCRSPGNNNQFWYCNQAATGTCTGDAISIFSDVSSCLPAPSCTPQDLNFTMRFHRCYGSGTGCSNACIGANAPWTMTITGKTLEYTNATAITLSATTICAGQSITASTSASFGVPSYSYNWSLSSGMTPSVGTTSSVSIPFPTAGSYTIYNTVTDQCGIVVNSSRTITVNASPIVTANPNPQTICTGQGTGVTLTSSMSNTSYSWTVVQSGVTGASNGSGNGSGGSSTYNLNQTLTNTGSTPGTATYTITPTASGCNGAPITVTVTVNGNNTVSTASSNPILCQGIALTNITFTSSGATGIGAPTGLPAGVTASFSGNTITISGTPTATGTFNYSIPLTGGCGAINATGTITINPDNTVGGPSSTPSICIGTAISPSITFTTTGATGIGTATGLPTGVSASFSGNTITISGTPTATGTFNYSIPLTGGCGTYNATGSISVTNANTIGVASSNPTICINTSISPSVTFSTTGATGIGVATGLPAGVSASFANNTITISGIPTVSGTYNYTIPLTGGCGNLNATGTITVNPDNTVSVASSNPTLCINTAISPVITFTTTGATGIGTATGLPSGVSASFSNNTITISGTPSATGAFNYSIPLTGGCGALTATGSITVTAGNTVTPASSNPSLCIGTSISPDITFTTTGATGIGSPTGLPAGTNASFSNNTITISGTPTTVGTYNYSIPLTGGCGTVNATGTITVTNTNTVGPPSSNPTLCINTIISPVITFTTTVATGIGTSSGLPSGVSATFANNTITVSGSPTVSGTFNYTIPLTGGCGIVDATGTITVNPTNTVSVASSNPTLCINTTLTPSITFTTTGATGIGSALGLPTGLTANFANNTITISGTPTASGTFNYSIPLTGGCGNLSATGTITVNPLVTPTFNTWGPFCQNDILAQVMLPNTSNNAINGIWNPGMLSTTVAGTINYVFTPDANQCASVYNMSIVVNPLIQPTFIQLGPYCQGGITGSLSPTSTNSPSISGTWNPSIINTSNIGTNTYTFTPSSGQCADEATMSITINTVPSPTFTANQTSGCTPLNVSFNTSTIPGAVYSWTVNETDFGANASSSYLFEIGGCYDISLTVSSNGCSSTATELDLVCVENPPIVSFTSNPILFSSNSENVVFTNNTTGASSYIWDFGDLSSSVEENPSHLYSNIQGGMIITLIASSALGCIDEATYVINFQEETVFYVPNSFTPDQDEFNQTWGPVFTQGFDAYNFDLYLFNRWGELIWESHDASAQWDGTYAGKALHCPDGIYTWKITYKPKETDEKKVITGYVNLIR
jgi:gliding motility-associated-like protein